MTMSNLLEIWGDTVDARHTIGAVALGVGIATPLYLGADYFFSRVSPDASLASSYALLAGLAGCLVAGFAGALLFKPKRVVTEQAAASEGRAETMDAIEAEYGPLGDPAELPEAVQEEVRALGLYDDLRAQHERRHQEAAR
ncbi:hypothetical protein [Actinorugispora endophytica]|uniref:Uncharacterized protein n=1 Tax=Actinorugispora endophytica TaxID=1605990 RepID=A0A4R6V7E7_9ACTN|nr:hypothetical protein [Actinorugispora endophytica]TDQ55019.1 hypothetical protein EV190_101340 [Actinorugispora endophytica]